jgi:hypothetical protein
MWSLDTTLLLTERAALKLLHLCCLGLFICKKKEEDEQRRKGRTKRKKEGRKEGREGGRKQHCF